MEFTTKIGLAAAAGGVVAALVGGVAGWTWSLFGPKPLSLQNCAVLSQSPYFYGVHMSATNGTAMLGTVSFFYGFGGFKHNVEVTPLQPANSPDQAAVKLYDISPETDCADTGADHHLPIYLTLKDDNNSIAEWKISVGTSNTAYRIADTNKYANSPTANMSGWISVIE